jgi:OOP family OmpA-OmpF porin
MSSKRATWTAATAAVLAALAPQMVSAQALTDMSVSQLRTEVKSRYNAALALSTNGSVIAQNSAVHTWASDAKVQCGIALGFLKSSTKDADSLRRCDFAYTMMNNPRPAPAMPAPPAPTPPPPPPADSCPPEVAATFFFDFDSVVPSSDAQQSAQFMQDNRERCGWSNFTVVGHTDRAGSDAYNERLSMRRGQAVADLMKAAGIPASIVAVSGKGESDLRVQTIDGERTPANRRVEVRVNGSGVN